MAGDEKVTKGNGLGVGVPVGIGRTREPEQTCEQEVKELESIGAEMLLKVEQQSRREIRERGRAVC